MTNETNEQKPEITMCKCGASYLDDQHPICPECMIEETTKMPPQEVEAKSEYLNPPPYEPYASMKPHEYPVKFDQNSLESNFIDAWLNMDINGRNYQRICEMLQAYHACRLRSSMGKVPSDERIKEIIHEQCVPNGNHVVLFTWSEVIKVAQAMRSEVAPVITGYAAREYILKCTSEVQKHTIALLRSELKQAKEALSEADKELNAILGSPHSLTGKFTALLTPKKR